MSIVKRLAVAIVILFVSLSLSPVYSQPFWTEKSTYSDGEYLFAVGIATDVSDKEDGRIEAFKNGVKEICNLKGVTELPGLEIRTQMTYEEDHRDGTYTVYRLLKINEDALDEAVEQQQNSSRSSALKGKVEPYVDTWPGGILKVKGYVKRVSGTDIKTGKWMRWYESGKKKAERNYKDGLGHGKYINWYENGQKEQEEQWRDGTLHGTVTCWYENGRKQEEVDLRHGKKHGKRILWYEDGQKYKEGEYAEGQLNGKNIGWYESGQKRYENDYLNGKAHGKVIGWYESGQIRQDGNCRNGREHGKVIHWYENGQKKQEEDYLNGKAHGRNLQWYENGQKMWEVNVHNGKQHGKCIWWYENGQKSHECEYKTGELISQKQWNEAGEIK